MKLYTFFNFTSIAATEKRPLIYKMPQSFHRPRYCGVQTLPLKMHYGCRKLGEWSDFDPQWNCDHKRDDSQTHRHEWIYNLSHAMLQLWDRYRFRHIAATPLYSAPPFGVKPSDLCNDPWEWKTRMMCLSKSERISKIRSAVLTQSTHVTDGRTELARHIWAICCRT